MYLFCYGKTDFILQRNNLWFTTALVRLDNTKQKHCQRHNRLESIWQSNCLASSWCKAIRWHKPFVNNMHFPEPQHQQVLSWQEWHPSCLKLSDYAQSDIYICQTEKSHNVRGFKPRNSRYPHMRGIKNKYIRIRIWRKKCLCGYPKRI